MSPAGDRGTGGQGPSGTELFGLAVLLAAVFLVPLLLGLAIDGVTHATPVFLLIGILVGIVAAGATIYTRFRRYL
jgi:F0F1-type ATP synthase assembly protein I